MGINAAIQSLLIGHVTSNQDIAAEAVKSGMITMQQDGFIKVLQGVTAYEEVFRVITE